MKKTLKLFLVMLLVPFSLRAEVVDKVVAVINNEPVTQYQLDQWLKEKSSMIVKGGPQPTKDNALQALIETKLIDQEIKKRNIVVTEQDVQKAIQGILDRNSMTEGALQKEVESKGTSYAAYKKDVEGQLRKMKLMGQTVGQKTKVTDADLDEFFAQNPEKFANYQSVEMAQIILPLAPEAPSAELEKAQKLADELASKARKGEDLTGMAKKYSVIPESGAKATYQVGQLAPQLIEVISNLKQGEVSQPVRSNLGLHIVKLYERKTLAGEEFKAIREQIRERVFEVKIEQEMQKYLDELKDKNYVKIIS